MAVVFVRGIESGVLCWVVSKSGGRRLLLECAYPVFCVVVLQDVGPVHESADGLYSGGPVHVTDSVDVR